MAITRFILLNRSERRLLCERVRAAVARWRDEWCAVEAPPPEIALCEPSDSFPLADYRWRVGGLTEDFAAAVGLANASYDLVSALIGASRGPGDEGTTCAAIVKELEFSALEAIATALLHNGSSALQGRPAVTWTAQPSEAVFDYGRGFAVVRCRFTDLELVIILYPPVTDAYRQNRLVAVARGRNELVPVRSALAGRKIVVEICAGTAELTLPELATLGVGDVIALDRRLDEPVRVREANGDTLGTGHLGTFGSRKAVQLTAAGSDNEV